MFSSNTSQASDDKLYVEDVFSTWLYTGNGSTQTITNGIDLAGKGGLVWAKDRTFANSHQLYDTVRGNTKRLITDQTAAQGTETTAVTAFNSNGFSLGAQYEINGTGSNYVSWTFREAPKFFDVVTGTCDASGNITVNHSLGSTPACVFIKNTSGVSAWLVYHAALGNNSYLQLNATNAAGTLTGLWNATATTFTANAGFSAGAQVVLYLFAHDTTADGLIQCGTFDDSSAWTVNLGWEPQWVLYKKSDGVGNWRIADDMRGFPAPGGAAAATLSPNVSDAEGSNAIVKPTATGMTGSSSGGGNYIYIAIRRGPMRVPTDGTKVFAVANQSHSGSPTTITAGFPVDLLWNRQSNAADDWYVIDRLRGNSPFLLTNSAAAEDTSGTYYSLSSNTTVTDSNHGGSNPLANYMFRRAPGFFDEVCYTGTGSARTVSHNLGVVPELMIVKNRSVTGNWNVYTTSLGNTKFLELNTNYQATTSADAWNNTSPTSSVFTVGVAGATNGSGNNLVAYLFSSCVGVSKVGTYTGTGTTQQINCGFAAGARFVLIKRNADNADWYVWDSARGITSGNDPYLLLNSTAAEVTSTDYIDPVSSGFEISSTAPAAINASGGSYIFLAIA